MSQNNGSPATENHVRT